MFVVFGVLILVLGIVVMMLAGLSLSPFFLPLDVFLYVALYLLVVLCILNFFFRDLEVRHNVRDSQKYLMARNSQRTALAIVIICVFVGVIVIFPWTATTANTILSEEGVETVVQIDTRFVKHFDNQDRLALFKSGWIDLDVRTGVVTLQICTGADFQDNDFCDSPIHTEPDITANSRYVIPQEGYQQLVMVITNNMVGSSTFTYHIDANPSSTFVGIQPFIICIIFIGINSAWAVYLQPTRQKYATSSIYSEDYVVEAKAGVDAPTKEVPTATPRVRKAVPRAKRRLIAPPPPPEEEYIPPPPLPGRAHPLPKGAFLNELIVLLNSEGDRKQTEGFLRTLIDLEPLNKEALFHLGDMFQEDGEFNLALNQYNRITKIDSHDEEAWVKRGDALLALNRDFDAVQSFREALKIDADSSSASERMHRIRRENQTFMAKAIDRSTKSDFMGAIELYNRILARDPENVQALLGKGTMYRRLEKWPASLESLNKVLSLDPDNKAALRNKAEVFESAMQWEDALSCYNEITERSPDNYLDWVRRGDVLFELERTEDALDSYKKAEELRPESDRVKKRIKLLTAPAMDEVVKEFMTLPKIGKAKAIILFEAGYQSMEDIEKASRRKLAKVKGISKAMAKNIKDYLEGK
jgi:tetratricopeptide (TPR) repeat protein